MCQIHPKHQLFFCLEAFTSHDMTEAEFSHAVATKLLEVEMILNRDGRFRFHIHDGDFQP